MHKIIVRENGSICTCGWAKPTMTGADAQRAAYIHARANIVETALVTDFRLCADVCRETREKYNCPDHWHHVNCLHRTEESNGADPIRTSDGSGSTTI